MTEWTSRQMLYEGLSLMADPIHGYIPFTSPIGSQEEVTEKALIDSRWMQRLRYIYQLQSARWVYPSAEHSRFVHSLGAMHLAGRLARHLYPSLAEVNPDCPSAPFIESLLRITALVHDIGHGPFCHFFDHHFLDQFNLTHEKLGQAIVWHELGDLIQQIRRSPGGFFAAGERLDPEQIAFLMHKDATYKTPPEYPRWLVMLKPLFWGLCTADNLDYVLRDAYMCGVAIGPVDPDRIIFYSFFTSNGLTLHRAGLPALTMFLNARSYLYSNVYYHRTTRALDMHLRDLFRETVSEIFPYNPIERLDAYLGLTDWSLLLAVQSWRAERGPLLHEWGKILRREIKWKMAYEVTLRNVNPERLNATLLEARIRGALTPALRNLPFRVDLASQDPRPLNPRKMGERQLHIYDPSRGDISNEALSEYVATLPAELIQCRIFAPSHEHDALLSRLAGEAVKSLHFTGGAG
jgi:HD superfamily phosphohydrolase